MIEKSVSEEYGIHEDHSHIGNLDPFVKFVFYSVAYGIEHEVAGLGEEPSHHETQCDGCDDEVGIEVLLEFVHM